MADGIIITSKFSQRCVAVDLEVGREDGLIHRFAAQRGDRAGTPFIYSGGGGLAAALADLDAYANGAEFVAGHNVIAFDLPLLGAAAPKLRLLGLPIVDTLRLSPLAFPRNPYHRLVKHYKDGGLLRFSPNAPELDSQLCLELLDEQQTAFSELKATNPRLLAAWHWLVSVRPEDTGFLQFFTAVRGLSSPNEQDGMAAVRCCLEGAACPNGTAGVLEEAATHGWPLAFALAWISVAGGDSVMPPWVRHEFPGAAALVRRLRNTPCGDPDCEWCGAHHDPKHALERLFGFSGFRSEPATADGQPMQEAIVASVMRGEHVLGILPTGTGKSVCYQVPALSRHENTGALTVVISPLVALMEDQIRGMQTKGVSACAALNGLLSMPERADALNRVRLGDVAILLVSPEQLRNSGFRKAVQQREIGGWVLDEAHCLSKWGHDFRTDYRYVGRFIREKAGDGPIPPVLCLTATAKPDVVADICGYFMASIGEKLTVFNGGANRNNLEFMVAETTPPQKLNDIHALLKSELHPGEPDGAIVYCATRGNAEETARFLSAMGWAAAHFHAGLSPEQKKDTLHEFVSGGLRVIAATNAFGMGIDKPDVRLVVHGDMPGSLENYFQEAGRAGRDQRPAMCVLMFCREDIERQFGLSARARLPQHEIQAVLRALRRMAGKRRRADEPVEVVATSGEILFEDTDREVMRDHATDDTKVRTAVSWLEHARLVSREENVYQVFPSVLMTPDLKHADKSLARVSMPYRGQLRAIVELLLLADPTEGVTTDELMGASRLSSSGVVRAMRDLERLGILTNDTAFTAYVHVGVENATRKRMDAASAMESALLSLLRETAPDLEKRERTLLHLRQVSQHLKNGGHPRALPEVVHRILAGLANDGKTEGRGGGSLRMKKLDAETFAVTLLRDWEALITTADLRKAAARLLMEHLLSRISPEARGLDLLAETTFGNLYAAVESDLAVKSQAKDIPRLVERALLWLHEMEVLRLGRGLVVLRPAMRIQVAPGNAPFNKTDYAELRDHYNEQVVQIHVMAEYARRGLEAVRDAMRLAADYFIMNREEFIRRWFPQTANSLSLQTTPESWNLIAGNLNNVQRRLVTDDRERTNVLVLAGPGSGKTRTLVHRIACLVRVRRENPRGILALAYNRHAAVEIRRRLGELIGDDARGVSVMTCHALAMRLTGTSFAGEMACEDRFNKVLDDAARLLRGDGVPAEDADGQRERLLAGFRWILVDEYQDIGREQYALISALAGRTLNDPEGKLSLFAVGDDDQNVYGFAGASVEYIRRFQEDYNATPEYMVENYRSTANIVNAANALIARAGDRMKSGHPVRVDSARKKQPPGGAWESHDPVTRGRVQILNVAGTPQEQAAQVMGEMLRLSRLDPGWKWERSAVVARQWKILQPVLAFCEANGIPAQRADADPPQFWRLRETQRLAAWLAERSTEPVAPEELDAFMAAQPSGPWWELLSEGIENFRLETGADQFLAGQLREWLVEWGRETRKRQRGLLLLTAHRVKGLEFDHVAVLDGGWDERDAEDPDTARRLYYVAMTRARETLTLSQMNGRNRLLHSLHGSPVVIERDAPALSDISRELYREYQTLTPGDVDLSFAGRQELDAGIHRRIAGLKPGDALTLTQNKGKWMLEAHGGPVGRLSQRYNPPQGMCHAVAHVHALLVRLRQDSEPAYADSIQCDQWEVVLPELVFTPPAGDRK
ncbi:MAG: RecQ family ATP-dependent DNA helicase [Candidatus Hydrogenedentes bacterium]|nr:RecQ family ATP-dependent DNA helicase [Candidatus Hydrogenedentota bacterium]